MCNDAILGKVQPGEQAQPCESMNGNIVLIPVFFLNLSDDHA